MGYDAYVLCTCYQEGKTEEPPCREFLKIDDEGIYLDLEHLYPEKKEEYYAKHRAFEQWLQSACPHEDMELCSERLSNIGGMMAFRGLLSNLGGEKRFPILSENLPVTNGGTLPAALARAALQEVHDLGDESQPIEKIVLRAKQSGKRIQAAHLNQAYTFLWTAYNKLHYGLDPAGFFIIQNINSFWKKESREVFRSLYFKQEILRAKKIRFTDIPSQKSFTATSSIGSDKPQTSEFVVEQETFSIESEYAYILEPLLRLLQASIQTGNPIIWC